MTKIEELEAERDQLQEDKRVLSIHVAQMENTLDRADVHTEMLMNQIVKLERIVKLVAKKELARLGPQDSEYNEIGRAALDRIKALETALKRARQFVVDSECDEDDGDVVEDRVGLLNRIDELILKGAAVILNGSDITVADVMEARELISSTRVAPAHGVDHAHTSVSQASDLSQNVATAEGRPQPALQRFGVSVLVGSKGKGTI